MSDNVVTHSRFATPDRLRELQEQGVVVVNDSRELSDIALQEPQYGETIVGSLTSDEKHIFFALFDGQAKLEDATRTLMGNQITRVGRQIKDSDRSKDIREAIADQDIAFEDDAEASAFFKLQKEVSMLHANFHYAIGERLNSHEYILGVRSQGRVVRVEKRY